MCETYEHSFAVGDGKSTFIIALANYIEYDSMALDGEIPVVIKTPFTFTDDNVSSQITA